MKDVQQKVHSLQEKLDDYLLLEKLAPELDKALYLQRFISSEDVTVYPSPSYNDAKVVLLTYQTPLQEQKALDAIAYLADDTDLICSDLFDGCSKKPSAQYVFVDEQKKPRKFKCVSSKEICLDQCRCHDKTYIAIHKSNLWFFDKSDVESIIGPTYHIDQN